MKFIYTAGMLLLTIILLDHVSSAQTKTLKPIYHADKIKLSESGRTASYFQLTNDNPSLLLIKGPGHLQVITRALIVQGDKSAEYTIFYRIDGGELYKKNFNSSISEKATISEGISGKPGLMRTLEIDLGPGEHSLEFSSGNSINPVIAKYIFKKTKTQKVKWVLLSPSRPNEPVDLVTHEDIVHYYRFSQKKPLKIKINGPTTLRILTRFENHYDMKGRINYRIQVKEGTTVIHTYLLSSDFSEVSSYRKNNTLIPGKAREIFVQVPAGRHTYTIIPLDKDKNTILARVLFPQKDVRLEE